MKPLVLVSLLAVAIGASDHTSRMRAAARDQTACQPQLDRTNRASHGWTNIGPGSPGVVAPVAVDPHGSGTIYVGSVGGGVRKSLDNGATWSTVDAGLTATAVYSLAVEPTNSQTVYAGAFDARATVPGGVFKTTDGGSSWMLLDSTRATVPTSLVPDPHTPGVVFMGLLGGAIRRLTNGGTTSQTVFNGTALVNSIVIDPLAKNIVYAATLGGLVKMTSIDEGKTWSSVRLTLQPLWGMAIDPLNDSILYVATTVSGVWRSDDGGVTWQSTGALPVVPYALAVDSSPAHTVYVATSNGVWESANDGAAWQTTSLTDTRVMSIAIGSDGVLYAGTTSGPAVSRDFGASWNYPDPDEGGAQAFGYAVAVDPNAGCKLFASTLGSDLFISDNDGESWTRVGTDFAAPESRRIAVDPTDSNRVYAGSSFSGLFKSTDGGATWARRDFGSGNAYVWVPAVDPVSPNIVYAGTRGEGLFQSEDYGENWKPVLGLPINVEGITVDHRNHNEVFAAAVAGGMGGVFRSHNQGETWDKIPVLARPAWSITIVGGDSPVVYATTKTDGVYRSLDGGTTWQPINIGITNHQMGRSAPVIVAAEDPQVLYVGSEGGGGVYRSGDGGEKWVAVNLGLTDTSVSGLAADPRRPGTLYVSGPHGIFATTTGGR